MESQRKTIKIRDMIETLIRRTINPKFRINGGGQVITYINKSLNELPKVFGLVDIDDERIIDFVVYQVYRMRHDIERGVWRLNMLFSDYAKQKYQYQFLSENAKTGINYYIDQWLNEYELTRSALLKIISDPKPSPLKAMLYLPNEEPIKRRFFNIPEGLGLCSVATTGYSPFSESCCGCNNQDECKKITKYKFPELFRLRTQENGKEN